MPALHFVAGTGGGERREGQPGRPLMETHGGLDVSVAVICPITYGHGACWTLLDLLEELSSIEGGKSVIRNNVSSGKAGKMEKILEFCQARCYTEVRNNPGFWLWSYVIAAKWQQQNR